jgi:hypothetical protein
VRLAHGILTPFDMGRTARMARRKNRNHNGPGLFDEQQRQLERRIRRQRALFIPRFLREAASMAYLRGEARDNAHAIAIRWADLETTGRLPQYKETSIDTQFLDQIFGEGLGYRLKTASPDAWQLEHKFFVQGVGTADAALGDFPTTPEPTVVVELKGALTDLDRDRSNGRTAVQQCWDYLNALPGCAWGIVSNFKMIRLYHHPKGTQSYEEFSLQELRDRQRFDEFYCLFERGGLLPSAIGQAPRALELLRRTINRQNEVGEDLYKSYHLQRLRLIEHLHLKRGKSLDSAIRIAQKLLDRVIFIAFCEDRELLAEHCLKRASEKVAAFSQAKNPLWRNFLGLFTEVDRGGTNVGLVNGYNGNLFKPDAEIDDLELDDEPWVRGFKNFGDYDFSEEVNVEVLGHLFERSITELEKLRVGGLFALQASGESLSPGGQRGPAPREARSSLSKMPKSAQRKRFGIYYTPAAFTGLIVERTVDSIVRDRFRALQAEHKVDPESPAKQNGKRLLDYWRACLTSLKEVTVCDPACGSGAFLIRAYDALDVHYKGVVHGLAGAGLAAEEVASAEDAIPDWILNENLYGADLSQEAVEITQLALWIRSARRGKTLADLSKHIVCGNSLVSDAALDSKALNWPTLFPEIFGQDGAGGFSCVIGNPPWERVKVQDREFFSLTDPITAGAVSAHDRKRRIAAMPTANPELHRAYLAAREHAQRLLDYARGSGHYPLTGKGDVNLYMLFAELAGKLLSPTGLAGLLVPSGIATDDTTKEFFNSLMSDKRLVSLYDFENRKGIFEDVHRSFKFSAMVFGGRDREAEQADFVFFAREVEDTAGVNKQRHISLTAADMKLLNPNTKTCPVFRSRKDAELTKAIYNRIPILIDQSRKRGGNPWEIRFLRMFDQTNDSEHFQPAKVWEKRGYKLDGNVYKKPKKRALPLYEAKMVQAFDHRAASVLVEENNWVRQGQKAQTSLVQHQNPEFAVLPRWWVDEAAVNAAAKDYKRDWLLCYKDVTSVTNERTMIASFVPWVAVVNSAPIMFPGASITPRRECCLLANLNSLVFDYVVRQKVGSVHLNFFIVEQLPTLAPDEYSEKCRWSKKETLEHWISERVLKLSCTSDDTKPLAEACGFRGSQGDGVHRWRNDERMALRAEMDAALAQLYGVSEEDFAYMLSTFPSLPQPVAVATLDAYRDLAAK